MSKARGATDEEQSVISYNNMEVVSHKYRTTYKDKNRKRNTNKTKYTILNQLKNEIYFSQVQNWTIAIHTQRPPYLNAVGRAKMPVPIFPFNRCINACRFLHNRTNKLLLTKLTKFQSHKSNEILAGSVLLAPLKIVYVSFNRRDGNNIKWP